MMQGDRLAERFLDAEGFEARVDVFVEIELPRGDQLHGGGRGEQLRDGSDAHDRALAVHGPALFEVGVAVALGEQHAPIGDDGDHQPGNIVALEKRRDRTVQERLQLPRVARTPFRRRGCREHDRGREQRDGPHDGASLELRASSAARLAMSRTTSPKLAILGLSAPPFA
jgi:hypothetical protein